MSTTDDELGPEHIEASQIEVVERPELDPDDPWVRYLKYRDEARDEAGVKLIRRAIAIIAVVVFIAAFGNYKAQQAGDEAADAATKAEQAADAAEAAVAAQRQESIDRQVTQCASSNEFRKLFRGYLETQSGGEPAIDIVTKLPGYSQLEPPVQEYVLSLATLLDANAANADKVREEYVANFPIQDCDELRKKLEDSQPAAVPAGSEQYASCDEAREAGDTPLVEGRDDGYNPALDRDKNGTACE